MNDNEKFFELYELGFNIFTLLCVLITANNNISDERKNEVSIVMDNIQQTTFKIYKERGAKE